MRGVILGTGGYYPNERRHTTCVMLPEVGVVFDAGTSFFRVPNYLQTDEVDIFLTHAHLDHIFGLTTFLAPLYNGNVKQVRVLGHAKTLTAVRDHLFAEALFPVQPNFDYVELPTEITIPGGGVLTHRPLEHPGGSTGYRIDWPDRALALITDTTVDGSYTEFVRGVDVLIHECNCADDMAEWAVTTGHSHTTQVAELARDAQVGRLFLMHIDPSLTGDDPIGIETARSIFPNTELAEDGIEFDF